MTLIEGGENRRRRRGAALEAALLEAAWEELLATGYEALSIEAVAERAQTSRAVLYRRWATKQDLVRAAVADQLTRTPMKVPDTGSLRGDLVAALEQSISRRARLVLQIMVRIGAYYEESGTNPGSLRTFLLAGRKPVMDAILDRAVARGEIPEGILTPRIRQLPLDLLRQETVMTLQPVEASVITEIVDDIFLPLLGGRAAKVRAGSCR